MGHAQGVRIVWGNVSRVALNRRGLLAGAGASLATACAGCPPLAPLAPAAAKLGDAHVHLFNAADLPVAGFVRYVVIPEHLPHLPEVALALVDAAVSVLKATAPSARAERGPGIEDTTPQQFANRFADRIESQARSAAAGARMLRPADDVSHSYAVLAALLRDTNPSADVREFAPGSAVDRAYLARIAVQGSAAARPDVSLTSALAHSDLALLSTQPAHLMGGLGSLWDTIKWCYEMVLPRCRHLRDYLATIALPAYATDLIVNLLVDYDSWLGDGPTSGSAMLDQLRFWDGYSRAVERRVEIRTFAGYDPLRHAEERMAGNGRSAYWDALSTYVTPAAPGVRPLAAGFKIYPPMGFRVIGNAGSEPARDRSGLVVRARWHAHNWDVRRFGAELDAALDVFFEFCARNRVPVVAHGRHSQEASGGTGEFASPRYWHQRARWVADRRLPPLRASIAHWTASPDFREWMPRILDLNDQHLADIYFDVAYSPEFLNGGGPALMQNLADVYGRSSEKTGGWLMFGSDWIMLGREPGVEHYAEQAVAAIRSVPWWRGREALVLHENLRRFVSRPA